jgi:hypothetical protein
MTPVEPYDGDVFDGSWAAEWVDSDGIQRPYLLANRSHPAHHVSAIERVSASNRLRWFDATERYRPQSGIG